MRSASTTTTFDGMDMIGGPDAAVRHELVYAVATWRTPGVDDLLTRLAADVDVDVRESAAWVLSKRPDWLS
ncbi:HEAT repeat domain-containing protein [Prescottella agglutinans]|uniref:HEAT repeat domain-containing protein n=1 Tax=Prescottella agglutinans TaxID=1644129 RepID=UPI003D983FBE